MKRFLARLALRIARYRLVTAAPTDVPVYVLVAAPHTSNWDFILMLAMAWQSGVSPRWLGKKQMFTGPFGFVSRRLGGIAVDREHPGSLVADLAAQARVATSLAVVVPAEGTRARDEYWKSGFYRIACEANIPIVLSYLDGPSRTGGYGPVIHPSGDPKADMDLIRAFYADKRGVKPENKTTPRLRDEEPSVGPGDGVEPTR